MWHVYLIECADGRLYCGSTTDLKRRVEEHNSGEGARYTAAASRRPVTLIWSEPANTRSAAQGREAAVKRLSRQEKLDLAQYSGTDAAERRIREALRAMGAVSAREVQHEDRS